MKVIGITPGLPAREASPSIITVTLTHDEVRLIVAAMTPCSPNFYFMSGVPSLLENSIYRKLIDFLGDRVWRDILYEQRKNGVDG